jgi:hypothetical protein
VNSQTGGMIVRLFYDRHRKVNSIDMYLYLIEKERYLNSDS